MAVLGAVLLAPAVTLWLARLLRPVLARLRPVEGMLAADSLIQAPRRTSGSVAALMLSLALVISLGGLARASYNAIAEWLQSSLDLDLLVTPVENLTNRTFVLPATLGDDLRAVEGVAQVQAVRGVRILVNNTPVMLMASDDGALNRFSRQPAVQGERTEMLRETMAGTGAIVSENFMRLHGGKVGDTLEIPSPSGIVRLRIAGVVRDFSDQQGAFFVSLKIFVQAWNDTGVTSFGIFLKPGCRRADGAAKDSGYAGRQAALVCADQRAGARLHQKADRPMVRADLRADRRGGAGGDIGHCADALTVSITDHWAAGAGRAAGGGRIALAGAADHLDGSGGHRRDRAGVGAEFGRGATVLQRGSNAAGHRRDRPGVRVSVRDRAGAGAGDFGGGMAGRTWTRGASSARIISRGA